jgi:glycosyl transferase family 25
VKLSILFGFYFYNNTTHHIALKEKYDLTTTIVEYIILSKSSCNYCFSYYGHGSGFSEQCSVLNNIPYSVICFYYPFNSEIISIHDSFSEQTHIFNKDNVNELFETKSKIINLPSQATANLSSLSQATEKPYNSYIDHIFYINLEKRKDRREHIESQLLKYDLLDISERYIAIETAHSGIVGCSQSHLNVLKLARERGYKNILILEDDFEFIVSKEELNKNIDFLFEKYSHFDVCMLSHIIQGSQEIDSLDKENPLRKVLDGQTASGYLVNSSFLNTLIDLYEWSCPLLESTNHHWLYANDMVWKKLQPENKWSYFVSPLGKQIDGYSDNKQCFASYN